MIKFERRKGSKFWGRAAIYGENTLGMTNDKNKFIVSMHINLIQFDLLVFEVQ
jgi:hypothetical protein